MSAQVEVGTVADFQAKISRPGVGVQPVRRMFNAAKSETFDPTEAVEVEIDGGLVELADGDEVTITCLY